MTDIELLAVILRSGTRRENSLELSKRVLYPAFSQGGVLNIHRWSYEQLLQLHGIGRVKAIQILCLAELAKRLAKSRAGQALDFSTPARIANYYMEDLRHKKQEIMKMLLLNTRSRLIGETNVSKGTVNGTVISPRELFVEALQKNAVSIILLHNHPSGDPTPSRADILLTKRVQAAGNMLGVELLDHIVIGDNRYFSLQEEGYFADAAIGI